MRCLAGLALALLALGATLALAPAPAPALTLPVTGPEEAGPRGSPTAQEQGPAQRLPWAAGPRPLSLMAGQLLEHGQAVCPEVSSSEEDTCVVSCNSDDNCPQGTKCCPRSPCSRSCVVPFIVPVQKAGHCPRVQIPLTPEPCLESSECSRDDQCVGHRKCCLSVCAMRCQDPEAEEPLQ